VAFSSWRDDKLKVQAAVVVEDAVKEVNDARDGATTERRKRVFAEARQQGTVALKQRRESQWRQVRMAASGVVVVVFPRRLISERTSEASAKMQTLHSVRHVGSRPSERARALTSCGRWSHRKGRPPAHAQLGAGTASHERILTRAPLESNTT